ncbi:hypothetical protein KAU11_00150 [Candidatus Babeliales bacterium]|nr:hypothetical protein [Candidatus Babeliales bacterium]
MSIRKYLKHTVDIVHVVLTAGVRSEIVTTDVPAFITQKTVVVKDEIGDHFGTRHVIFLEGDTVIDEADELIVDGKQRPIVDIFKVRDTSTVIHHLEVEVQ